MERRPLLDGKPFYSSTEDSRKRPPLRSSISYDELPPAISGYFGENYHCIITPPRGTADSTDDVISESSSISVPKEPPKKHRPIFICLVSIIDIVILVYSCIAGSIETIGLISSLQHEKVPEFGSIHKAPENQTFETFGIYPGRNILIGPNASFLVRLGAMFPPCMREDQEMTDIILKQIKEEKTYVCCSLNKECGMMKIAQCPFHGRVGNVSACTPSNSNCKNGVKIRPCCSGLHAKCTIMSQQKCSILKGHWHSDKLLCGDVNCLDGICGMTGAHQTYGDQFYRLITPIFIHIGILHLLTNLVFQVIVGCKIEMEIGTLQTGLIYLISGLGGNLFSGIFTPLMPQVGSSGALFGLMALLLVYYIQNYTRLSRPFVDLCALISTILFSFALGTIPYIGNFVHIGGFVFGLLTTIVVSKHVLSRGVYTVSLLRYRCYKAISATLLIAITAICCFIFYTFKEQFCTKCKYVDCIPWTTTFCPDMTSDGILNQET